ncbi:MAG: pseudouridine synthase [Culicoidibacterales bacterium]
MAERLQKVIANAGFCSRRKAEQLILDGKVTVDGKVVRELGTKVEGHEYIEVGGVPVESESKVYLLLNKPKNMISAVSDDREREVVTDCISSSDVPQRIYPVGRLDYDTSGALLLTNDGEFANLMMHPSGEIEKVYVAKVRGRVTNNEVFKLEKGVNIDGRLTAPAKARVLSYDSRSDVSTVRLVIHEGRYHQVKRMFENLGFPMRKLRRTHFSFLTVDDLQPGQWRRLSNNEVSQLRNLATEKNV